MDLVRQCVGAIALAALGVAACSPPPSSNSPPRERASSPVQQVAAPKPQVRLPAHERAFCDAVSQGTSAYGALLRSGANELKLTQARTTRARALTVLVGVPKIDQWVGQVKRLTTTTSGNAHLEIALPCNSPVMVATWNNELSDRADGTLIPQSSPLFSQLAEYQVGALIVFSGLLKRDDMNTYAETSITEKGSMTEPSFLIRLVALHPLGDAAPPEIEDDTDKPMKTRFGVLRIAHGQDHSSQYLVLGDQRVFDGQGNHLTQMKVVQMGGRDIVWVTLNAGGSGSVDEFVIVMLSEKGWEVFKHEQAFSSDGSRPTLALEGERLIVDLGFEKGFAKRLFFDGTAIKIDLQPSKAAFSSERCKTIFERGFEACLPDLRHECSPSVRKMSRANAGYVENSSNHPAFKAAQFEALCQRACVEKRPAAYDEFAAIVCGIE
jgi:hypothetical protein